MAMTEETKVRLEWTSPTNVPVGGVKYKVRGVQRTLTTGRTYTNTLNNCSRKIFLEPGGISVHYHHMYHYYNPHYTKLDGLMEPSFADRIPLAVAPGGLFLKSPDSFSAPKNCFVFVLFAFKIKVPVNLKMIR